MKLQSQGRQVKLLSQRVYLDAASKGIRNKANVKIPSFDMISNTQQVIHSVCLLQSSAALYIIVVTHEL